MIKSAHVSCLTIAFSSIAALATAPPPSLCVSTVGVRSQLAWGPTSIQVVGNHAFATDRVAGLLIYDLTVETDPIQVGSSFFPFASDVVVNEERAYVTSPEYGLRIFDVGVPSSPIELGRVAVSNIGAIEVADGIVYLGAGGSARWSGLKILDVSNPSAPIEIGVFGFSSTVTRIVSHDDILYLALPSGPMLILDVSDPTSPREVARFACSGGAIDLAVSGGTAFVASLFGLRIVDVSDPADPVQIGFYESPIGGLDGVWVSGNTAIVSLSWYLLQSKLQILDVSVLTNPVLILDELEEAAAPVFLDHGRAYARNHHANGHGLRIFDLDNPSTPALVAAVAPPHIRAVRCARGHAYTFENRANSLRIAKIPPVGDPYDIGDFETPGEIHDLALAADLAYIACGDSGFGIVDVAAPTSPIRISWPVPTVSADRIAVSGDLAFVMSILDRNAISIIDVSDPASPTETAVFEIDPVFELNAIAATEDLVLIGVFNWRGPGPGWSQLWIIDVSDPHRPFLASSTDLPSSRVYDIDVMNGIAHLAMASNGLLLVDITHPEYPIVLGNYVPPVVYAAVTQVSTNDGMAYLTGGGPAFEMVDVSNPRHPIPKGTVFDNMSAWSLAISEGRACLVLEGSQLVILDLSSPSVCERPRISTGRRSLNRHR